LTVAAYTNKSSFDLETVYALLRYHDKLTTTADRDSHDNSKPEWTLQVLVKLLDEAVLQGLLANSTGSTNYGFEHDRIQQAAFGLVSSGQERDRFRLNMGLGLLALATKGGILRLEQLANTKEWMLFTAADHLNASSFLYRMMRDHASAVIIKSHDGGDILTHLNCHVGYLAANKAAYETASKYLNLAAQELMHINKDPWDSQYEMTLKIYTKMVEVELWQGHFEKGRATAEQILTKSRTPPDRLPTQLALAKAFGREENHIEALRMAITALKSLKVYPVCKYGCLVRNLLYVKRYFRRKRDDEILSLPLMTDERCLMAMEFLSVASYQAYYVGNLPDFLVMMLLMLRKTFVLGLCGQSAVAFIGYALLCNNLNDMEGAHRFSTLSRQVLNRTKAKHLEAIQMLVVAHWITGWRDPHPQVLTVFERGYRSGMETGDFENALLCMSSGYHHEYAAGYPLPVLDTKYAQLAERLRMYKIDAIAVMVREQWRKIQHLMGRSPGGNPMDVNELGKFGPERGNDGSEKYRLLYGE
jgi:histidine kinase